MTGEELLKPLAGSWAMGSCHSRSPVATSIAYDVPEPSMPERIPSVLEAGCIFCWYWLADLCCFSPGTYRRSSPWRLVAPTATISRLLAGYSTMS
jgi:hypothetical protein